MRVEIPYEVLQKVTKPARYTGGEFNAVIKNHAAVDCTFALALPDVYEVGMSNLGLAILYNILNSRADCAAERVYAPWLDMEEEMRARSISLFALESKVPIKQFDFFGFSLQYEMIFTNVLNMLDLASIPLRSIDRGEDDPFIVGGGPCVYNVEPVADFFDFFVVGEGEEVLNEVVDAFIDWKRDNRRGGRREFLRRLLSVDGIYVPSFYEPLYFDRDFIGINPIDQSARKVIYKRVVHDMNCVPSVERPIVPYLDVVHNRIMLELFRGCTRGCRFCQAGMSYRPARERSEENLRSMARRLIDASGYDEISLTSLSSADYSCLRRLVDDLIADFRDERVSFSLPSLRIDSFSIDLAHRLQQVRKSGLTFAPEAGTQRLRDVINKGVTEDDLMTACAAAFERGWQSVKLYFMMGLPTETDEDILGIARLAKRVVDLYVSIKGKRGVRVTVSVSCFVPKPWTPFQWFAQVPIEEFRRRQQLLKDNIRDRAIVFNYHDSELSSLEGVLARGDRRLSKVIETAWQLGAKFDGWSDHFDVEKWNAAFEHCGIDRKYFNERAREFHEFLPWDHTSPGVRKNFLRDEWERAELGELTSDCRRTHCQNCGVCPQLSARVIDYAPDTAQSSGDRIESRTIDSAAENYTYRAKIRKGEEIAILSHLDYVDVYRRALIRSKLPAAYSQGFDPHMKMSFGSALAVGTTSDAEYFDFELTKKLPPSEVLARLNEQLPRGAEVLRLKLLRGKVSALMASIDESRYEITVPFDGDLNAARESVEQFNRAESIEFTRVTPKKTREIELKRYVKRPIEIAEVGSELRLTIDIVITPVGSVKPIEVLQTLSDRFALKADVARVKIHRVSLTAAGRELLD